MCSKFHDNQSVGLRDILLANLIFYFYYLRVEKKKAEAAGGCVVVEQVGEVGGGLVMEGFASEEKDFKVDPLLAYDIYVRKPDFFAWKWQKSKAHQVWKGGLLGSMSTLSKFHDCESFLHEYISEAFVSDVVAEEQSRVIKNIRFSWFCGPWIPTANFIDVWPFVF